MPATTNDTVAANPAPNGSPPPQAPPSGRGSPSTPDPRFDFESQIDNLGSDDTPAPRTPSQAPSPEPSETKQPDAPETPPQSPQEDKPKGSLGDDLDGLLGKKSEAKPASDDIPKTPKALREEYQRIKAEATAHASRIKELEAAVAKAAEDGRVKAESALQAKLDAAIKERDEFEAQVRYLRYEESNEFKTKYKEPLIKAWKAASEEIEGLTVRVRENEDGTFQTRPVTTEDLWSVINLPAGEARARAQELFGPAAPEVMRHRSEIRRLTESARTAKEEWKQKGSAAQAQESEAREAALKQFSSMIDNRVKELSEAAPDYFGDVDDPELKPFIEKSKAIADLALGRTKFKEGTSPEEIARARAKATGDIVARGIHFPRLVHALNARDAKIKELESQLAEYQSSEPSPDKARDEKQAATDPFDFESQIDSLA